jgi:glycine/D-amino acid oxidase-like deaminating enzyme
VPPIEQSCFWLARRPPRECVRLEGRRTADVVVVGAGLTGLWTALFLRELSPGIDIAIVEQQVAAYGASGRNGGILSETVDHDHGLAIQHFGEREARRLARIGAANIAEMVRSLADQGIQCDYEATGRLIVALSSAQLRDARRQVEVARRLGLEGFRFLDREQVRAKLDSPLYLGGVGIAGGGILDPVKLVDGLCSAAERAGVRVYQESRVEAVERVGAAIRVRTEEGRIDAGKAVLATSAYTHHLLPGVTRRFIPLYDYVLVSEPLTPEQHQAIGWSGRQGVTDGRAFFNYYRLTTDNRLLWGTSEAAYYSGNRVDPSCDHSPSHYAALRRSFERHFPPVADLEFPYAWGGPICSTTRLTPFFGSALGGRLLYGLGYTGHGLGTTRIAGRILAHLALERPSELLDLALVRRQPFPYPPEPLRSWAVGRLTRALRRTDQGEPASLLLRLLDALGIGFSS